MLAFRIKFVDGTHKTVLVDCAADAWFMSGAVRVECLGGG